MKTQHNNDTAAPGRVFQHRMGDDPATAAVALKYDGEHAPRVTAKGSDELAQQIIAIAESEGVPLHEAPELVTLLSLVELGDEIPRELYVAVAEVIAFAYMVTGRTPDGFTSQDPMARDA